MATATTNITIKKVTGFLAPDGSHHPTAKAAAEYVQTQAIKASVEAAFEPDHLEGYTQGPQAEAQGVDFDDRGNAVIYSSGIAKFLLANRDKILAALQPKVDVRQRKPRTVKAKTVVPTGTEGTEQR